MSRIKNKVPCRIVPAHSGRYIVVNDVSPQLAWTGARWTQHKNGVPSESIAISDFKTLQAAEKCARGAGFEIKRAA